MRQSDGANLVSGNGTGAELASPHFGKLGIDPADMVDMGCGEVPGYHLHLWPTLEQRGGEMRGRVGDGR
jgi:hypothetical protein